VIDGAQNNLNVVRSAKGSSPFARDIAHAKPPRRILWNASLRSDNTQRLAMLKAGSRLRERCSQFKF
jgi:hypothetical protein